MYIVQGRGIDHFFVGPRFKTGPFVNRQKPLSWKNCKLENEMLWMNEKKGVGM